MTRAGVPVPIRKARTLMLTCAYHIGVINPGPVVR